MSKHRKLVLRFILELRKKQIEDRTASKERHRVLYYEIVDLMGIIDELKS